MRRPLAVLAALLGAACSLNVGEHGGPCGEEPHTGPTPQQLVFVSDAVFGQYDICLINTNGTAVTQLTTSLADDWWPSWSPDGSMLAFHSAYANPGPLTPAIYVVHADGTGLRQIKQRGVSPAWSPDGSRLAFIGTDLSAGPWTGDLVTMAPDGSNLTVVNGVKADPFFGLAWNAAKG